MKVNEFMTSNVITCYDDQTVEEAAKIMTEKDFSVMPIIDRDQKLVGILTESDFIGREAKIPHALASIKQLFGQIFYFNDIEPIYKKAKKRKLSEVMTRKPITVKSDSSLTNVINIMISKGLKRLPVVDSDELVGIVTRKDLLKAFVTIQ